MPQNKEINLKEIIAHSKEYGFVPPIAVKSIAPLLPPKQLTALDEETDADKACAGSVIVSVTMAVHPLASVTVNV